MNNAQNRILAAVTGLVLHAAAGMAAAQNYPDRPIRIIVAFPPGASTDVVGRIVGQKMTEAWGQNVVIENRPGAGGNLGTQVAVRANPDGYTIGYANVVSLAINKSLLPKAQQPYDPDKDLVVVGQFLSTYNMLAVTNALPVKSVKELIDYARQYPGKLTNASGGNGTTGHLGGELFKIMTGTQIVHVPYKGSPQGISDLIGGQVQLMFDNLTSISPHVRSGKVRGIGVSSAKRSPIFPDIPTIAEAGVPGYETNAWGGLVVPVGTPKAIVTKLNSEVNKALRSTALKDRYAAIEADPVGGTPEEFTAFARQETAKWADVVKKSGAKLD